MEHDSLDKMLDEWIDQAVAGFGKADARPGFEERMIAGLHGRLARRMPRFSWQAQAAVAGAVAMILLCVFFARFADHGGKEARSNIRAELNARSQNKNISTAALRRDLVEPIAEIKAKPQKANMTVVSQGVRAEHSRESLPRQEVFPSAGLSDQDGRLLAYVRSMLSSGDIAFSDDNECRPIEINKVEIPKNEISRLEIEPVTIEALQ